jgi:pyruvate/2-oxoglutarate dehydrogenase complex dihydrolipoamide acyltransferase (E2) component
MTGTEVRAPRLNANSDEVKISRLLVKPGDAIAAGALLAEIESDKTTFEVCAESAGFVIRVEAQEGEMVAAGGPILWIGESPDTGLNGTALPAKEPGAGAGSMVTAKARALLREHGIEAADIPATANGIVTAAQVEAFIATMAGGTVPAQDSQASGHGAPHLPCDGREEPLTTAERAMARTVAWHAQAPVPAYLEVPFDHESWRVFALAFLQKHALLADPALALLAYRLVSHVKQQPRFNAALTGTNRFVYASINLGFAMQTKDGLVLAVLQQAQGLSQIEFVKALQALQKRAVAGRLTAAETSGATLALTSLAIANASRHIPILPPHTSLIAAHSAKPAQGPGAIGATYDHRLHDGYSVAKLLSSLSRPTLEGVSGHDA